MNYIGITSPTQPIQGQMRYNPHGNLMETYDGTRWVPIMNVADPSRYRLDVSEGRVAGARYYTVEPVNASGIWPDMITWTVETFGPTETIWQSSNARWYANNSRFWFRERKDLDWFVLRWGSE